MIDIHSHLLPGIDDGPATVAESVEMARVAVELGTRGMVCTPHMAGPYPTDPREMRRGVTRLRAALGDAAVPLEIHEGGEIALDWLERMSDEDLALASIGGGGSWLLLEMPFRGWPLRLADTLRRLDMRGFRVVLAHPERAESIQRAPDRMRDLIGLGALVQLTASSFLGDHGAAARRTAAILLGGGAAHLLASDSHSAGPWRAPGLEAGLRAAADTIDVDPEALGWMVGEGPAEILAGGPVRPPRLVPGPRPRAGGARPR